jgi:ribosome-associated protein
LNKQISSKERTTNLETINDLIIDSIQDIKGKDIIKLDLRDLQDSPADFFIICSGDSNTQMRAIAGNIYKRMRDELGWLPSSREGQESNLWVLVDYFNTIVHIFHPEGRAFYELEELWSDAKFTEYQNI